MALLSKGAIVDVGSSSGNVAFTGVGFQPKFLMLVMSHASSDNAIDDELQYSVGMTDGTNQRCAAIHCSNNVSDTDTRSECSDDCVAIILTVLDAEVFRATLVSFDTDGFTLNFTAGPSARQMMYIALGGNIRAFVGDFDADTGGGTVAETGVGFMPDVLISLSTMQTAFDTVGAGAALSWGATSTTGTSTLASGGASEDGVGAANVSSSRTGGSSIFMLPFSEATMASDGVGRLSSYDADGFTHNWTLGAPSTAYKIMYAAIRGVKAHSAQRSINTGTGSLSFTGVGFQPECIIFLNNIRSTTTPDSFFSFNMGYADASTDINIAIDDDDADDPTNTSQRTDTDDSILFISAGTAGGIGSVIQTCDVTSFDADGFTINKDISFAVNGVASLCLKAKSYPTPSRAGVRASQVR